MQGDDVNGHQRYVIYFRDYASFFATQSWPVPSLDDAEQFEDVAQTLGIIGMIHGLTIFDEDGPYIGEPLTIEEARKLVLQ